MVCALVAVASVVAGCGGGHALALDPVAAAATKTQDAGAARIRYSLTFSSPQLQGKTVRLKGIGVIDGTSSEANFELGSGLEQEGIPAGTSITEISVKDGDEFLVYMQLGALAGQIPGGKQWLKLDLSKLGKAAGIDLNQLMSGSQLQPTDLLSMLKTEGGNVRKVGSTTIDGTPTTHFHVTVDLAKALQVKGLTNPMLAGIAAAMPTVPEDVWVGRDGLVRRIKLSFALRHQGKSMSMAMAMDLYDYGADLTVAAPPSSEVFDATELAQQGIRTAGSGGGGWSQYP